MNIESWDAVGTIKIANNTSSSVSLATLGNNFQIGSCTSSNAIGITKRLTGIGQLDPVYLQAGYPYTLPVGEFVALAAGSTVVVQITLQGCAINAFDAAATSTTTSLEFVKLSGGAVSRAAIDSNTAAPITYISRPPNSTSVQLPLSLPAIYGSASAATSSCVPATVGLTELRYLNSFWGTDVKLCLRSASVNSPAYAIRELREVHIDPTWLVAQSTLYGPFATTGVLAHEWGHIVQGNQPGGSVAELQADCLAGAHLKWAGVSELEFQQFERIGFFSGDSNPPSLSHGTGNQRVAASRRGYDGFNRAVNYSTNDLVSRVCSNGFVY